MSDAVTETPDSEIPDPEIPHSATPAPKTRLKLDLDSFPEQTSDDRPESWGEASPDDAAKRQRYLADKPPHHGD